VPGICSRAREPWMRTVDIGRPEEMTESARD
jgi:hypothetical protein